MKDEAKDFAEELKIKTKRPKEEEEYKERMRKVFPAMSDEILEEKFDEETLKRMFCSKEGEER